MSLSKQLLISGSYNNKSIISLLTIDEEEKVIFNKILFLLEKNINQIHSILDYNNQIFVVGSFNGIVYKYDFIEKKSSKVIVGKDPRHIERLDKKLYITNFESNNISVIDTEEFRLIESIPTGIKPHDIAVDSKTNKIFISCYEENIILEYEINTKKRNTYITYGKPIHLCKHKNRIFVLTYLLNGNVSSVLNIINIDNKQVEKACVIKGLVTNIKYDSIYDLVYMINIEDRYLYYYNLSCNKIIKALYLGGYPEDIEIGCNNIYISNSNNKDLLIINRNKKSIRNKIPLNFSPECLRIWSNHF